MALLAMMVASRVPAWAQSPGAEARRYFDAGKQAYAAGDYAGAAMAFEEARRLDPRPAVAFSLAQAHRHQYFIDRDPDRLRRAVALLKEYLEEQRAGGRRDHAVQLLAVLEPLLAQVELQGRAPVQPAPAATQLMVYANVSGARAAVDDGPLEALPFTREVTPGPHRVRGEKPGHERVAVDAAVAEGRLTVLELELRERPAALAVHAPPGARVFLDGRDLGRAPFLRPVGVRGGRHRVVLVQRGRRPAVRELAARPGEAVTLRARLEPTGRRVTAYWAAGGAAALAASATTTLLLALAAQEDARQILARRDEQGIAPEELETYDDRRRARDRLVTATAGLSIGAAAVGVVATVLYLEREPDPRSVVPLIGPGALGLSAGWRF